MLKIILDACTILGGLSAIWFFFDKYQEDNGLPIPSNPYGAHAVLHKVRSALQKSSADALNILGIQWILAVFILGARMGYLGLFGLAGPFWLVPLCYFITRYVCSHPLWTRISAGLAAGMIGATICYIFSEDVFPFGLTFGLYFGTLVAGRLSTSVTSMTILSAFLNTALLFVGLGVAKDLDFYVNLRGHACKQAFGLGSCAVLLALVGIASARLVRSVKQRYSSDENEPDRR